MINMSILSVLHQYKSMGIINFCLLAMCVHVCAYVCVVCVVCVRVCMYIVCACVRVYVHCV